MNKHDLERMLRDAPEPSVKVSDRLHDNIIRSVRLAAPQVKRSRFGWMGPALGGALAVLMLTVLQFSQPAPVDYLQPQVPGMAGSSVSLQKLGDRLKGLTDESRFTENELRLEMERLKSDLKRFDFRS